MGNNGINIHPGKFIMPILIVLSKNMIWPIQGMHQLLRSISRLLPLTCITSSLRSVMSRGWRLDHPYVFTGFATTLLWTSLAIIGAILALKFKKG